MNNATKNTGLPALTANLLEKRGIKGQPV